LDGLDSQSFAHYFEEAEHRVKMLLLEQEYHVTLANAIDVMIEEKHWIAHTIIDAIAESGASCSAIPS